ncbi:MAG: hypothetical protein K2N25_06295, partial [Muribaculaceae bacterium]|nr:hypothetical protein [Muribaculaceae bacterium]
LEGLTTTLRMSARMRIQKEYPALEAIAASVRTAATGLLEKEKSRLDSLERLTEVLSPTSTLKRGYSITRINGKAITDPKTVSPGEIIETQTAEGTLISIVSTTLNP